MENKSFGITNIREGIDFLDIGKMEKNGNETFAENRRIRRKFRNNPGIIRLTLLNMKGFLQKMKTEKILLRFVSTGCKLLVSVS